MGPLDVERDLLSPAELIVTGGIEGRQALRRDLGELWGRQPIEIVERAQLRLDVRALERIDDDDGPSAPVPARVDQRVSAIGMADLERVVAVHARNLSDLTREETKRVRCNLVGCDC